MGAFLLLFGMQNLAGATKRPVRWYPGLRRRAR
jgi:hypothetical protein